MTATKSIGWKQLSEKACPTCAGYGFEPTENSGPVPCSACGGGGYRLAEGDLGPTRSKKSRPYSYDPGTRLLTLWDGRKPSRYTVGEFAPQWEHAGRAFQLVKEAAGESYCLFLAENGQDHHCDCAAHSYESSAKADRRAYEAGDPFRFLTAGCKHVDAIRRLLTDGWLDLPETPRGTDPETDPFA